MVKVYFDIMPNLGAKNQCYPYFTIHQEMLDYPPEGIDYEIIKHKLKPSSPKTFSLYFKVFKALNKYFHLRDVYYKFNELTQPNDGVIHAGGHIRFGSRPWVADFEHINLFWSPERIQINLEMTPTDKKLRAGDQAKYAYEVHYLDKAPATP